MNEKDLLGELGARTEAEIELDKFIAEVHMPTIKALKNENENLSRQLSELQGTTKKKFENVKRILVNVVVKKPHGTSSLYFADGRRSQFDLTRVALGLTTKILSNEKTSKRNNLMILPSNDGFIHIYIPDNRATNLYSLFASISVCRNMIVPGFRTTTLSNDTDFHVEMFVRNREPLDIRFVGPMSVEVLEDVIVRALYEGLFNNSPSSLSNSIRDTIMTMPYDSSIRIVV